ncbi:hypothetical protein CBL_09239 [Carabus blaptoides fortunei]
MAAIDRGTSAICWRIGVVQHMSPTKTAHANKGHEIGILHESVRQPADIRRMFSLSTTREPSAHLWTYVDTIDLMRTMKAWVARWAEHVRPSRTEAASERTAEHYPSPANAEPNGIASTFVNARCWNRCNVQREV